LKDFWFKSKDTSQKIQKALPLSIWAILADQHRLGIPFVQEG
jgi:hypothetical protein